MYCDICGEFNADDAEYCSKCGVRLSGATSINDPDNVAMRPLSPSAVEKPQVQGSEPVAPSDAAPAKAPDAPGAEAPSAASASAQGETVAMPPVEAQDRQPHVARQAWPQAPSQQPAARIAQQEGAPQPIQQPLEQGAAVKLGSAYDFDFKDRRRPDIERTRQHNEEPRSGIMLGAALVIVLALGLLVYAIIRTQAFGLLAPHDAPPAQEEVVDESPADDGTTEEEAEPEPEPEVEVVVRESLAEYSWEELAQISDRIEACDSLDEALIVAKTYNLVSSDGSIPDETIDIEATDGTIIRVRLVGIYHDQRSGGGYAGLTFMTDGCLTTHEMKEEDTNEGGWAQSEMRSWLNMDVLSLFPDEVANHIEPVVKLTNNVGNTNDITCVTETVDRLWIPSIQEVCGDVEWSWGSDPENSTLYNAIMNAEGSQYAWFGQNEVYAYGDNDCLSYVTQDTGDYTMWWLRSSSCSVNNHFRCVDYYGAPWEVADSSDHLGVVVGFCL